ncbi:MAG: succinylglutamate desuccinylase/aspartoacylase family protein, partial [Saprospiraceae bacterium]
MAKTKKTAVDKVAEPSEEIKPKEGTVLHMNGQEIWPGTTESIRLYVGRLPIGARIHVKANVYRAIKPGPTMLVIAGIHGDEITGTEIVRRAISEGIFDHLISGSVIAIPLLNVFGFLNDARDVPDGKDVNRSFPGNTRGSLASRLARVIGRHVLPIVDFGIDFHSGGDSRYNHPQIRFSPKDPAARDLAMIFDAPVQLAKTLVTGSLRKTAFELGIPMLIFEGGESKRLDNLSVYKGLEGLKRVLRHHGMLEGEVKPNPNPLVFRKSNWMRATFPGILNL